MSFLENKQLFLCSILNGQTFSRIVLGKIKVTVLLVTPVLLLNYRSVAQAQVIRSPSENIGIPSSSERFFGAGRENFEAEIRRLQSSSAPPEDLLNDSSAVQIRQELLRLEDLRRPAEESPSSQVSQPFNAFRQKDRLE